MVSALHYTYCKKKKKKTFSYNFLVFGCSGKWLGEDLKTRMLHLRILQGGRGGVQVSTILIYRTVDHILYQKNIE